MSKLSTTAPVVGSSRTIVVVLRWVEQVHTDVPSVPMPWQYRLNGSPLSSSRTLPRTRLVRGSTRIT